MKIKTERLVLRPFKEADLPYIIDYATKPEFYKYLPVEEQTAQTIRAFFKERMVDQLTGGSSRHTFAIALIETDRIIGTLRIEMQDTKTGVADIGYAMDQCFEGQGYMTEAISPVLQFGFETFGATEIWAQVLKENTKSWKLLDRIGLQTDEPPELLRQGINGNFDDQYNYVLRRNQREM